MGLGLGKGGVALERRRGAGTHRILARLVVDANMGDMHGVGGRRDGRAARGAQHAAHEGGEGALFLCAARQTLLCRVGDGLGAGAAIAVAVGLGLASRGRGGRVHVGGEGARLSQVAGRLVGVRVLWASGPTWCVGVGCVEGLLDDAVEGLADGGRGQVGNRRRELVVGQMVDMRVVLVLVDGRQRGAAAER